MSEDIKPTPENAEIAEKEILRLRAALERIACRDQGDVGPDGPGKGG